MSRADSCYDNALMESCFGTIKTEREMECYENEPVARKEIGQYIRYYNTRRRHSALDFNDNESGLHADYERWLEELVPFDSGSDPAMGGYLHNRTGEDNADANHKRHIMGREVVVAITAGKLHLGPWEHVFCYEFDGRRRKRVLVKIIGE